MATFWTPNRSLKTGNGQVEATFVNGIFATEEPDVVNMLRGKIKMRILEIVETTPVEIVETAPVEKPKTTRAK